MSKLSVNELTDETGSGAPSFPNGVSVTGAALTDPEITGGIYLGGTGSANYLEDYEEGTWTPILADTRMDYSSVTGITVNDATYTKVGNVVRIQGEIQPTGADGADVIAGIIRLGGLPFSGVNTSDGFTVVGSSYARNAINSGTGWHGFVVLSSPDIRIAVNGAQPNGSDGNDQPITFFAVYETSS